jgi:predicted porin
VNTINCYYAYINYAFSKQFSMRFGRQFTLLAPVTISQYGGWMQWMHIVGIGFGNQNHTSLADGITASIKLSPMAELKLGIFDNDTDNGEVPAGYGTSAGVPATALREENDLPRFDAAVHIHWGPLFIAPSFSYLTQEYDQVVAGSDNDVDCWGAALSARAGFGPFTLRGEITFGENMADGTYNAASLSSGFGGARTYVDTAGNNRVADEENTAWFLGLSYKMGPATINAYYGQANMECEGNPLVGLDAAEFDVTTQMYGVSVPISVGGGFIIRPEVFFYDYDDDALQGGVQNRDLGEEAVISLIFMLAF